MKTLTQLFNYTPTDLDYNEYTEKLADKLQKMYKKLQFDYTNTVTDPIHASYNLILRINAHEHPDFYKEMRNLTIERNLEEDTINEYFKEAVLTNQVLDLGEGLDLEFDGDACITTTFRFGADSVAMIGFTDETIRKERQADKDKKEALKDK